jgi:hypothetical protein
MSQTPKYEFDKTDWGTQGWNNILKGNVEEFDDNLHSRILITLGESVAAYQPVYLSTDGKYYAAKAVAGKVPAAAVTIESGNADQSIRAQRIGWLTLSGGTLTPGLELYVKPSGGITQARPREFAQKLGQAFSAGLAWINIGHLSPIHFGVTNTTPATPTGYPDGTIYFEYEGTTTTTTSSTTTTTA